MRGQFWACVVVLGIVMLGVLVLSLRRDDEKGLGDGAADTAVGRSSGAGGAIGGRPSPTERPSIGTSLRLGTEPGRVDSRSAEGGTSGSAAELRAEPQLVVSTLPLGMELEFVLQLDGDERASRLALLGRGVVGDYYSFDPSAPLRFCGVARGGELSRIEDVAIDEEGRGQVHLRFDSSAVARCTVYDGLTGYVLAGVRAELISVMGQSIRARGGRGIGLVRAAPSDPSGRIELHGRFEVAHTYELVRDGYRSVTIDAHPNGSGSIELGDVPLEPVDVVEIELIGFDESRYQEYLVGDADRLDFVGIDANGVAALAFDRIAMDPRVVVKLPDGEKLTVTLSGQARDHEAIEIDVSSDVTVEVEWACSSDHAESERWVAVVPPTAAGTASLIMAPITDGQARFGVPFTGAAALSGVVFEQGRAIWGALRDVELTRHEVCRARLACADTKLGVRLVDTTGRPIAGQSVCIERATSTVDWCGTHFTDGEGWLTLPGPEGAEFLLSAHFGDASLMIDQSAVVAVAGSGTADLVLGPAQHFEVLLTDGEKPVAWEVLTLRGRSSGSIVWSQFTQDDGTLGGFDVIGSTSPICRVAGAVRAGESRVFELRPGLNTLSISR
ncbi:MAG: hypothetical protein R3F49_14035 [Planctomycetota bacterium]